MSTGLATLHKILKDETRRKIILQLQDKGRLSYVDLMKILEIESTGKINYHLKILGDLITKTQDSKYALTERGKVASRLLLEFPDENTHNGVSPQSERRFWIGASVFIMVYMTVALVLYFSGVMDFARLTLNIGASASAIVLGYFAYRIRVKRAKWSPKRQTLGIKISYILVGATIGAITVFFGGALLIIGVVRLLQSAGITIFLFQFDVWAIVAPIIGLIMGGVVGYLVFKRSKYSKNTY